MSRVVVWGFRLLGGPVQASFFLEGEGGFWGDSLGMVSWGLGFRPASSLKHEILNPKP